MVREWKEMGEREDEGLSNVIFLFWAVLVSFSIVTGVLFSCAGGGTSKDKASAHNDAYGASTCAGCGAGCGGGCGG